MIVTLLAMNAMAGALIERYLPAFDSMLAKAAGDGTMLWAALAYAALLAIPFVPGVEIGLGLLVLFGAAAAPVVWAATMAGLSLAYVAGRLMPVRVLTGLLRRLGATGLAGDFEEADALTGPARARVLLRHAPPRAARMLLRHDRLALAVLFNMPGNAVIGGGGGIALIAGLGRFYTAPRFVAVTALAAAPVPVAFALSGLVAGG